MKHTINRLVVPPSLVAAAARTAAIDAVATLNRARREIALPAPLRRPLTVIHAEAQRALRVASSLSQTGGR